MSRQLVRQVILVFSALGSVVLPVGAFASETSLDDHDALRDDRAHYYALGSEVAANEYSGRGAFCGGLAAGTAIGPIGYALGWVMVRDLAVDTPQKHLEDLSEVDRDSFTSGYVDHVAEQRKQRFRSGALIGCLVFVVWVSLLTPIQH